MSLLDNLAKNVIDGNAEGTKKLVNQALDEGIPPDKILNQGLIAPMTEVGRLFEIGEFYVPEMFEKIRLQHLGDRHPRHPDPWLPLDLSHDAGDIERLAHLFPLPVQQGFDGRLPDINWE